MSNIIISLAPTGPIGTDQNKPVSPADLIETAKHCYIAGASVIHLHARDPEGNLTTDMRYLRETFTGILNETKMLIEASTGGLSDFTAEHLGFAKHLIDEGKIGAPYNFSFFFNVKWGMVFSEDLLKYLVSQLPSQSNWGVILIGSQDFTDHIIAVEQGADIIRVGFEDSNIIDGRMVESNIDLVSAIRDTLEYRKINIIQGDMARENLLSA